MTEMEKAVPKVGDVLILDGVDRIITSVTPDRNRVTFDNPKDAPTFGTDEKGERVRLNPSRAGTAALGELLPLTNIKGAQLWYLAGRLEKRVPREGAAKLSVASHNINEPRRAVRR